MPLVIAILAACLLAAAGMYRQLSSPPEGGVEETIEMAVGSEVEVEVTEGATETVDAARQWARDTSLVEVVIDPGHGGSDGGTAVFGLVEKDLVLDIGKRLANRLRERGINCELTREDNRWVSLSDRVEVTREYGSPIFVSLHLNRFEMSQISGAEAYITEAPETAEATRAFAAELLLALEERCGVRNRGVRNRRMVVTRELNDQIAVLLECGYLSNPVEAWKFSRHEFRQQVADALADVIERKVLTRDDKVAGTE